MGTAFVQKDLPCDCIAEFFIKWTGVKLGVKLDPLRAFPGKALFYRADHLSAVAVLPLIPHNGDAADVISVRLSGGHAPRSCDRFHVLVDDKMLRRVVLFVKVMLKPLFDAENSFANPIGRRKIFFPLIELQFFYAVTPNGRFSFSFIRLL